VRAAAAALHLEGIMARLEGKVAIVTGASSGIGYATPRLFADEARALSSPRGDSASLMPSLWTSRIGAERQRQ
jgi:NAD(P)-dependent dehydrogenase (short-subunit alcohol dehydrogenase family)